MWFKNIQLYRLPTPWDINLAHLIEKLKTQLFTPGTGMDMQTQGWVSPREEGELVYASNHHYLLCLRTERKLLPSSVINQATKLKANDLAEQQGFRPGRKQLKEIKEAVTEMLLPKAFSVFRDTFVWIDPRNGWLAIDAASPSKCDEVVSMLSKSLDSQLNSPAIPFPLQPIRLAQSPSSAMTDWLATDEAPAGFSIDQDTELKASGEQAATVRYVRHSLEVEEIQRHIAAGKQCTRLAMTWQDKLSFVLTDNFTLKRLNPLDILKENNDTLGQDEAERFESDFILMSTELNVLFLELIQALGGEKNAP